MKTYPWIVAILIVALCLMLHFLIFVCDGSESAPPNWQVEQDSLRAELDREKIDHLNDLKLYTDSLKAYTDSAVQVMPPAPVVKERAWKFFEFAPLSQAIDSLNAE